MRRASRAAVSVGLERALAAGSRPGCSWVGLLLTPVSLVPAGVYQAMSLARAAGSVRGGSAQVGRVTWTTPAVIEIAHWQAWTARWWAAHKQHQILQAGGAAVGPVDEVVGVAHPRRRLADHAALVPFVQRAAQIPVHEPLLGTDIQRLRITTQHDRQHRSVTSHQPHRGRGQVATEGQLTHRTEPTVSAAATATDGGGGRVQGGLEVVEVDGDGQVRHAGIVRVAGGGVQDRPQRIGLALVARTRIQLTVDSLMGLGQLVDLGLEQLSAVTGQEPGKLHTTAGSAQPQGLLREGFVLGRFRAVSVQRGQDLVAEAGQLTRVRDGGGRHHLFFGDGQRFDRDTRRCLLQGGHDDLGLVGRQRRGTRQVGGIRQRGGHGGVLVQAAGEGEVFADLGRINPVAQGHQLDGVAGAEFLRGTHLVQPAHDLELVGFQERHGGLERVESRQQLAAALRPHRGHRHDLHTPQPRHRHRRFPSPEPLIYKESVGNSRGLVACSTGPHQ